MPTQGPHDIRGLIPYDGVDWFWWIVALLIVAGAAVAVYLLLRWSQRLGDRNRPAVAVDPYDLLEKSLRALEPRQPFDRPAQRDFYYALSFALRETIEERSGISATDMTVEELTRQLQASPLLNAKDDNDYLGFLKHADLVKFADHEASLSDALDAKKDALSWFKRMRPAPQVNQDVRLG